MGIYDRDYVRNRPGPGRGLPGTGGIPPMRMWSANTWLIVACVAIFVIDGFLPRTWVFAGVEWNQALPAEMRVVSQYDTEVVRVDANKFAEARTPLRDPQTGLVVGRRVHWSMPMLTAWLHFSTTQGFLGFQFWRFIGFQFLHAGLGHLFFNMLALFFFGPLVERYLGSKRYVAFYLLAGICGAAMFLVLNLGGHVATLMSSEPVRIPGLLYDNPNTPLVGASAGVFGVLMAGAYLAPRATVLLFFFLPMQLRTLAYALVVLAFIGVITGTRNAGGEAGHLGGAIAGFYFIRRPHHLHNFFDVVGWLDPTSHHYRRGPARGRAIARIRRGAAGPSRAEVDRILDKVHAEGLGSLTETEKRILHDASERGS